MADVMSTRQRSVLMGRIRGANTSPELELRRRLWRSGVRYRLHDRSILGRPDIVVRSARLAIFVDGCFWHSCPKHRVWPKSNVGFWRAKLKANRLRDAKVNRALRGARWSVVRVWEHEVDGAPDRVVRRVLRSLGRAETVQRL